MQKQGTELVDLPLPDDCRVGTYVTPAVYEIADAGLLKQEVFGPILHVVRYSGGHLDKVIDAINATGYGLTLGLHSRIAAVADFVAERARVGNLYVNRNQIGAVVGVQPFGGEGLSGTGPEGRRPALPRPLRHRARAHHRHHRHRRQRRPAGAGGGLDLSSGLRSAQPATQRRQCRLGPGRALTRIAR